MTKKGFNQKIIYTTICFLIFAVVLFTISIFYFRINKINKIINNNNIYSNIYVENIDLSNLSKEEANFVLNQNMLLKDKFILKYNETKISFDKSNVGLSYDFEKAIEQAYSFARDGKNKDRYKQILALEQIPKSIPISYTLDEQKLTDFIKSLEQQINQKPSEPTLKKTKNGFEISNGKVGFSLNSSKLINDIKASVGEKGDTNLELDIEEIKSDKGEQLKMVKHKIGGFSTKYKVGSNDQARITNMKVASSNINGVILYPNEIFSTNQNFKPTTKDNGYQKAPVIIAGKFIDEYGGGVCQVSSTLYNAVLYSELEIVERQNHSLKVGYLDYGYDATLAGDYIDFKFKNNTNYPIYIESYLTEDEVICNIYGYEQRASNRTIKFENVLVQTIPTPPKIVRKTDTLPLGEQKIQVRGLAGYKYKLYKLIYEDDKLTEKVFVNNSYYKPRTEEVFVGTGQ